MRATVCFAQTADQTSLQSMNMEPLGAGVGPGPAPLEVARALQLAHALVEQGNPMQALKVVADVLRAVGMEHQAGESVSRVQQALAVGSSSAAVADELAGLLSLVSLQQAHPTSAQGGGSLSAPPRQQQPWQHYRQQPTDGPAGMEVEGCQGGTGPGPPAAHEGIKQERLGRLAAAAEGASYMCPQCGGVVALTRQAAHQQLWCPALHGS